VPITDPAAPEPDETETMCCSYYRCTAEGVTEAIGHEWYCDEHAAQCASCNTYFPIDYVYSVDEGIPYVGEYLCSDCGSWCSSCGDVFLYEQYTCDDCSLDEEDNEGHVDGLRGYMHKPPPIFHGAGPLYLGVEQEMEFQTAVGANNVIDWLRGHDPTQSLFYPKHDSSLNNNGIEIVSHPMSPEFAIHEYPWELQGVIGSNSAIPDVEAGLHIHVSRAAFTKYHLWKFTYFHYANPTFIRMIAGRDPSRWGSLDTEPTRKRMTKPGATDFTLGGATLHSTIRKKIPGGGHHRYTAVNLCNEATAEMRYFASTYDPAVLKGYFEYVRALYDFTNMARVRNRKNPDHDLSGLAFRRWAESTGDYPHFINLLTLRDIPMESLGKTANNVGMEWKEQ
jgi:hypothetical protein